MEGLFTNCFGIAKALCWWNSMSGRRNGGFELALRLLQRAGLALLTCVFASGGAVVGVIAGAMKGQTTETGFCRGAAIGVMSGAIVAIELLDGIVHGHFLSKVALFGSIWNGKAFREWVSPAVLKAYQWQTSIAEGNGYETEQGIYDFLETKGLPADIISKLPEVKLLCNGGADMFSCAICLQDLVEGEVARILPKCGHMFHQHCVDEWLVRNASCPVCRNLLVEQSTIEDHHSWGNRTLL